MAGGEDSYPILLFNPVTAFGRVMAGSAPYCASFFLMTARCSGLDRTRMVSPSAS